MLSRVTGHKHTNRQTNIRVNIGISTVHTPDGDLILKINEYEKLGSIVVIDSILD